MTNKYHDQEFPGASPGQVTVDPAHIAGTYFHLQSISKSLVTFTILLLTSTFDKEKRKTVNKVCTHDPRYTVFHLVKGDALINLVFEGKRPVDQKSENVHPNFPFNPEG